MRRGSLYFLVFVCFLVSTKTYGESDYQIMQRQRLDTSGARDEAETNYDSKNIDSFKAKALETTAPKKIEASQEITGPVAAQMEAKIHAAIESLGNKLTPEQKSEIYQALTIRLIQNKVDAKAEEKTHSRNSTKIAAAKGSGKIKSKAQASSRIKKDPYERIAEINKLLENPHLDWNEFEKLLDERKSLESQMKSVKASNTQ